VTAVTPVTLQIVTTTTVERTATVQVTTTVERVYERTAIVERLVERIYTVTETLTPPTVTVERMPLQTAAILAVAGVVVGVILAFLLRRR